MATDDIYENTEINKTPDYINDIFRSAKTPITDNIENDDKGNSDKTATKAQINCSKDDIDTILTCSICDKQYKDPKLLVCLHSFCAKCVGTYMEKGKEKIICQYCRTSQLLPAEGLSGVTPSYTLQDLTEVLDSATDEKEMCEACEKGKNPEFFCTTCSVALCEPCRVAHGNLKITKNHEVLSAKSVKMSPMSFITSKRLRTCEKHGNPVIYRCVDCGVFVCHSVTMNEHKGHRLETLEELRNKQKKAMHELERKAKQAIKFAQTTKNSADTRKSKIEESFKSLELKLDHSVREAIKTLNEQAGSLRSQIRNRKEHQLSKLDSRLRDITDTESSATSIRNVLQKITTDCSDLDALTLFACCEQIFLKTVTSKTDVPLENEVYFRPSDALLRIHNSKVCGSFGEMGNYPDFLQQCDCKTVNSLSSISGMARNKYGEIALTSCWNNHFVLLDPDGKTFRDISKYVVRPWDVAFTNDNEIVISESGDTLGNGKLKLFSPCGMFLRNIHERFKSPGGITVDKTNRIFVCDDHQACVQIFTLDGAMIGEINFTESEYQFQGPLYITDNINGDIIVSDDHRSVKIFTSDGSKKAIYNAGGKNYLQGVCTDCYGQIFVLDSSECGIHVLTSNGILRRFIKLETPKELGEMQSICSESPTRVLIAGKGSKLAFVELFHSQVN